MNDRDWFLCAVLLFGAGALHAIFLWRGGFRRRDHLVGVLLAAGFACTTIAMLMRGFNLNRCPIRNLYEAVVFVTWSLAGLHLILGFSPRLRFLGAFASPVLLGLGIFALMPAMDPKPGLATDFTLPRASLHATIALLSYGALGLGAIAAGMHLAQTRSLKRDKTRVLFSLLPPIQRLETVMGATLTTGFILLTLGMVAGFAIHRPEGATFLTDIKVLWTLLVWSACLGLILWRRRPNGRGRVTALGMIILFLFVLLTFWGVSLLSPLHTGTVQKSAPRPALPAPDPRSGPLTSIDPLTGVPITRDRA